MSKVASARVSPAPSAKAASPRRWPRADMACSVPTRGPPSGRSTCASRRPPAATPATAPSASWPGRVSTTDSLPPARRGELLGEVARGAVVVDAVGEPHDRGRAGAAERGGDRLRRRRAVGRERLRLHGGGRRAGRGGRLDLQADGLGGVGGRRDQQRPALAFGLRDQPLDHVGARRPLRRGGPAVVDHQHDGAGARERLLAVGIEHRLGQRQDHQRGRQHADQRQPPGRLRRRLLAVLDADQDAGRRELDALRPRRDGAQQPPDHRQGQQAREQPGAKEGDGPERHGVPPAAAVCGFQR